MAHKVTIKDIAEKTGTSVTSVHRALYGSKGISDSLRKKILREVEHSNYRMD
ncbi:MAG TPA: LacI family DNA-binding transcriptional regulator, partial [Candidatus Pelethocola excrementipullorum]|nr:LacI family DNA-binding transcriptional regulator [Candidatus Pelethocola excrementipullorum]